MDDLKFHAIICGGLVQYIYVGSSEEAGQIGADYQRKFDKEDKVTSKWKRKRHVNVQSVDGKVGTNSLKMLAKVYSPVQPTYIGMDTGSQDSHSTLLIEDGKIKEIDGENTDVDSSQ